MDTRATGVALCLRFPIQRRFVWSRVTGREGRSVDVLGTLPSVFASAMCKQLDWMKRAHFMESNMQETFKFNINSKSMQHDVKAAWLTVCLDCLN